MRVLGCRVISMRTKKQQPKSNSSEPAFLGSQTEASASSPVSEPSAPDGMKRVGVAWYIKEDGKIDLSRMRQSTREQLKEFLADSEVKKTLGLDGKAGEPAAEVFSPEWSGTLYDGLGEIMAMVASRMWQVPLKDCKAVLAYTEKEKQILSAPTAAVINKYATGWLVRFKEEIALMVLLGGMTLGKMTSMQMLSKMRSPAPAPKIVIQQPIAQPQPQPEAPIEMQIPADPMEMSAN